ncbi:MAG: tRNA-dependent cyclodipeptide synthase [Victivallales bacterium]|nr:tRNA-dependent cyclodipeptide synthase [Victivallales bacterium]
MLIKKVLNSTEREIRERKFNIFIGISLGNKYFTKPNIKKYIQWALRNTKDKVVVLVADKIHAINYEVRRGYSPERSLDVALRKGKEIKNSVIKILNSFSPEEMRRVIILRWEDIEKDADFSKEQRIVRQFYDFNSEFKEEIRKIVRENINPSVVKLKKDDHVKLEQYPLAEFPLFINGINYEGKSYTLIPYPGISKIDLLAADIQQGRKYSELGKKLGTRSKCVIVEAYAE